MASASQFSLAMIAAFTLRQAQAALFAISLLCLIVVTSLVWPADAPIARYDFLLLGALVIQAALLAFRLETRDEAVAILVFHVVGTAMEVYKTEFGSWAYPEPGVAKLFDVPLFTGFMYSAVGSYIARAWRLFDLRFERHPPLAWAAALALAAYVNFYTHHFAPDVRYVLFGASVLLFGRCVASAEVAPGVRWRLPMLGVFLGVAGLLWIAENIGSWSGTWAYSTQLDDWRPVAARIFGSWFLLIMLSYVLVALIHRPDRPTAREA